ncbi:hypothetical protein PGH12_08530 [Chryseobacterium wangxinyae]|uniref:hypothetical protein n=1 Tax=Chryseobacterium sp. CY350 TaxID=2997336 RepID=UPI00226F4903|nr:hypothetical protein [Chryseobacterium sp. CY350]MCY0979094.1 hypothetical protein [Chryseobacterium sp. CY350]WBZ97179.1 hypothetical protein PGH12_08530 [Chryseobacterium sp. CY350]
MKNFYRNFSEEDLIAAYLYMSEHTGKIDEEMTEAIKQKFNYDEFVSKANRRTSFIKEKGRISFEVYNMVKKGDDLFFIIESISSSVLNNQELEDFIIHKYHQFSLVIENNKIDLVTIYKSFFGVFISSIIGFLFFWIFVLTTNVFSFFLLVPIYIINYFVIRFIVGKTRDNLIVFLAVFISVIISTLLPFLFFI